MPRKARIDFPGAFFHLFNRGNRRKRIFHDSRDYISFLDFLSEVAYRWKWTLHGYCLMPNHFHLLLEVSLQGLSNAMQALQTRYAKYYNKRYRKVGHLFQGRFKSLLCEKDPYLLELSRYIHNNPVKAKIVKDPMDWDWSSFGSYMGQESQDWLSTETVLSYFGTDLKRCRKNFALFVGRAPQEGITEQRLLKAFRLGILGSENFIKKVKQKLNLPIRKNEARFPWERKNLGEIKDSLMKSLNGGNLALTKSSHGASLARAYLTYIARRLARKRLEDLSELLQRSPSSISENLQRFELRLKRDNGFNKEFDRVLAKVEDGLKNTKSEV